MIEATPQHLLDCIDLVYDDLLKRPEFVLEAATSPQQNHVTSQQADVEDAAMRRKGKRRDCEMPFLNPPNICACVCPGRRTVDWCKTSRDCVPPMQLSIVPV
ncbi:hypothetical protein AVEN_130636-1 [Araneus ventricosus]|uniref:Uncharacterized protein n=1 Tax=Araneus ventricosus TaxID=182803 RepID=A0A4Y2TI44_ARAVE|nr:hypothetical protein AVEN_130636-1 [Araneus ventricosus]